MTNIPKVSIVVPVFNHEKFIEKAIDSILMQKVYFDYEVWIGEDCSTDNTRDVLKKIEKKCGDNFHFLYREVNTYHNHDIYPYGNSGDLKLRTAGEFIITLEGDDYWIDENKLQKQVDFLNTHPDYYACSHDCIVVDENSKKLERKYIISEPGDYNVRYLASNVMPGQTATFMYRNPFIDHSLEQVDFLINPNYYIGDRRNVFYAATNGKIYIMPEKMSAYRYIKKGGSSFSATDKKKFSDEYPHYYSFVKYCRDSKIDGDNRKYAEFMLYFFLLKSLLRKNISFKEFRKYSKDVSNHTYCLFFSILYFVKKGIFKKKISY